MRSSCRTWSLDLINLVGDADFTLKWYYGVHQANRNGNDHFVSCAQVNAAQPHPSVVDAQAFLRRLRDADNYEPWVRVQLILLARLSAKFTLDLTVAPPSQPDVLVVPPRTHYNMVPWSQQCGAQVCTDPWPRNVPTGTDCWLEPLAGTTNPLGDNMALQANLTFR